MYNSHPYQKCNEAGKILFMVTYDHNIIDERQLRFDNTLNQYRRNILPTRCYQQLYKKARQRYIIKAIFIIINLPLIRPVI